MPMRTVGRFAVAMPGDAFAAVAIQVEHAGVEARSGALFCQALGAGEQLPRPRRRLTRHAGIQVAAGPVDVWFMVAGSVPAPRVLGHMQLLFPPQAPALR